MSPQQKLAISLARKLILLVIVGVASIFVIKTIFALGQSCQSEYNWSFRFTAPDTCPTMNHS